VIAVKYGSYLKFAGRIIRKQNTMPLYLVFFITDRCLARCKHCLLGQRVLTNADDELSLSEIEQISKTMGELMFLLLTGGDPMLRTDLPEIVRIFHRNNRVRNLGIPTNGSIPHQVLRSAEEILRTCPELDFAIDVSIDGIGEDHDEIRQFPGLFERAVQTYKLLEDLKKRHHNFNLNIALTVSSYNQDNLSAIYAYLRDQLGVVTINQLLTRGAPRNPEAADVDVSKYLNFSREIANDLYERQIEGYSRFPFSDFVNAMKNIRQEIIAKILVEQRSQIPCYAGYLSCVLCANGDLYPCELLSEKIGNLREVNYHFPTLWNSEQIQKIRNHIKHTNCFCTYECFLTNSILFNSRMLPKVAAEIAKIKIHRWRGKWTRRSPTRI